MNRLDISDSLIHFTKGEDHEAAFKRLQKIISEKVLVGSNGFIKGKYNCVCFTEAPIASLAEGLLNIDNFSKYSPFGILVRKQWLYAKGGRPVIYQTEAEYKDLADTHRWRHVRYEIREEFQRCDYTWEREWRIRCECLSFNQISARIVVPDFTWAARLRLEHDFEQDMIVQQYSLILDDTIAEMYRESFPWTVMHLKT